MQLILFNTHIIIANSSIENTIATCLENHSYSKCVIISDENIYALHGPQLISCLQKQQLPVEVILVPRGESAKTLQCANYCWSKMFDLGVDRHSLVIGLGGGAITDLAGYIAGCYMRGIDLLHIPTTLLGMVDAAIGGKTGVNLADGKNLIGLIYHPKWVIISPHYLYTLPHREFCAGLAEVIKYGVIRDAFFFEFLENNIQGILKKSPELLHSIIIRCCEIKVSIVQQDERERDLRAILNWGHTVGHALEAATHYVNYLHGEAIAIGMSCAAYISHASGFASQDFVRRQDELLQQAGLSINLPPFKPSIDQLLSLMANDKKAISGRINLIIAKQVGEVFKLENVEATLIRQALHTKMRLRKSGLF